MKFKFKKLKLPKLKKKKLSTDNIRVKSIGKSMILSITSILIALTLILGLVTYLYPKMN